MMDIYTKLSSRTVKQHVSSFNMQVTNKRSVFKKKKQP